MAAKPAQDNPGPRKTDEEWSCCLSPQQFDVLRKKGTECAFTGPLLHEKRKGVFECAGCGAELFSSEAKFDSGTGWPSFFKPIAPQGVAESKDFSHGMARMEVVCPSCGGHLGHVFPDGPPPTRLRYCINSAALKFREKK